MKVKISGVSGRMGQAILRVAKMDKDVQIVGALECNNKSEEIVTDNSTAMSCASGFDEFLSEADVLIDFTSPNRTLEILEDAKKYEIPIVIGTTGFTDEQKKYILEISKNIPTVFSPNMSLGVNMLFKIVEDVVKKFPDYDIEIIELHHNKKKDSPSGTATELMKIAATSVEKKVSKTAVYGRHYTDSLRKKNEIGIFSIRAGDIVGEHTVYFAGTGERLEFTHRAHSRDTFAFGAIRAAKWIVGKKPGLYNMIDVLNLNAL
ncbi:MAG: 4-hydroxy-tetrahydrodipicolinate reductase [Endomicrobium sp.]|jgi:4-hydroxy-tetrahydrodipicolinate reductase|nr:4-hydroxy-tetrahydrodipicolinate reductase [Endomicrobium sp.]